MSYLTDIGYLRQPHTSAGRVPTEKGYRFFVGRCYERRNSLITERKNFPSIFSDAE